MSRSLRVDRRPVEEAEPEETSVAGEPSSGEAGGLEGLDRLRVVMAAAMGTVLVTYAMLVPAALLVVLSGGGASGSIDGAFAAAIPLWLAAHQIPLELEGQPLSVLPLLPTLGVLVVVALGARWAVRRLGGRVRHDAGAVVAALAGSHAAVAVLGSALLPRAAAVAAAPWAAMVGAAVIAGIGASAGVLRTCGVPAHWRERLRGWPAAGLAAGAVGGAALLTAGALAVLVGLGFGAVRVHAAFEALAPTGGAAFGATLLSVAYLPNAVVGGMSWVLGPGVDVGLGSWTPFGGALAPLPPFPLLGGLPGQTAPAWAVVVVIVPVGIGLLVGGVCRQVLGPDAPMAERLRAVAFAAAGLAVVAAILALLAGGRLAAGAYDPVAVPVWLVFVAVLVWIGAPAAVLALVQRGAPPRGETSDEDLGWYRDGYTTTDDEWDGDDRADERWADEDRDDEDRDDERWDEDRDDRADEGLVEDEWGDEDRDGEARDPADASDPAEDDRDENPARDDERSERDEHDLADESDGADPRTDDSRTDDSRTDDSRTDDSRTDDSRTDDSRADDSRAAEDRAADRADRGRADHDPADHDPADHDPADHDPADHDPADPADDGPAPESAARARRRPSGPRGRDRSGGRAVERARTRRRARVEADPAGEQAREVDDGRRPVGGGSRRGERTAPHHGGLFRRAPETDAPPTPEPDDAKPRTVGELVALRARQAEERAAAEREQED
ncbi:cell division protein PerM [Pseudonocardia ailaonensis]|uniref:cell division protein PerM n=1 Tax=Pseudonocardia ailaonensis TaxID=367279 RepID=UPI0031E19F6A